MSHVTAYLNKVASGKIEVDAVLDAEVFGELVGTRIDRITENPPLCPICCRLRVRGCHVMDTDRGRRWIDACEKCFPFVVDGIRRKHQRSNR